MLTLLTLQASALSLDITGSKSDDLLAIRGQIRDFKATHGVDKVIVLWTANTERFCDVKEGLNDTEVNILAAIKVRYIGGGHVYGYLCNIYIHAPSWY